MLWNASKIKGYEVQASDGLIGKVSDFLFEDNVWKMRWLVVETGNWFAGRKVLLPLSALGYPNQSKRKITVSLTCQQVKDSPDVDTNQPVSRQMEHDIYDFYGWDPYWSAAFALGGTWMMAPEPLMAKPLVNSTHRDPLRSLVEMIGYHIHASDGDIGHVDDFLIDDIKWHVRYIVVETNNWWPQKTVVVSPAAVQAIELAERYAQLNMQRQQLKNSPQYDPQIRLERTYEERLRCHYR